jgi:hypothetical protein
MTATLAPNGNVLIAGGSSVGGPGLTSTELYSSSTYTFAATNTVSLSFAREFATATMLTNGQVLIAGGFTPPDGTGGTTNTTDLYTP